MKSQGEIEAAVCDGISRFQQELIGRGPKDIHSHLIGTLLVVRLQGVLTPSERQLIAPREESSGNGNGIKHDGNPFVGWQLGNCEVYVDVNGNVKVRKNENDKSAKVDGIIALIIATHCSLDNPTMSGFGFRTF